MDSSVSKYRAVILIAGDAKRLRPLTYNQPKCLVEVSDGKTILDIQLDALTKLGIKETFLIIGHYGWKIREKYGSVYNGMKLRYLENPFYAITGGAHSLWLARKFIKERYVIIMDGDHILSSSLLLKLLEAPYINCILVDTSSKELREETQVIGQNGVVRYLAWSQDGELRKHVTREDCVGEALIVIKLAPKASSILADELDRQVREEAGILEVIDPLNNTFRRTECWYIPTDGTPWIEVDFEADLEKARKEVYPKLKGR